MFPRNNHGHAVLLWLRDNAGLMRLVGHDGKPDWHTTTKGKALLYVNAREVLRDGETIIHSPETFFQPASIEDRQTGRQQDSPTTGR